MTIKVKHPETKHSVKASIHRLVNDMHAKAPASKTKHTPEGSVAVALSGRGVIAKAKAPLSASEHSILRKHK